MELRGSGGGERGGEVMRTFFTFDEATGGLAGIRSALERDSVLVKGGLGSAVGVEA